MSVLSAAALPLVALLVQSTTMATLADRGGPGYVLEVSGLPVDEIVLRVRRR
jgi:hypothetical protein